MDRRTFVQMTVGAALGGAGFGCASMVTHRVTPSGGAIRLSLADYPALAEPGGSLRMLPDGWREPIYVLALEDGGYAAVSPICTHRGCTVDVSGEALVCPCHGSTYDRRGRVLVGPAEEPLRSYAVRAGEGAVVVRLDGAP